MPLYAVPIFVEVEGPAGVEPRHVGEAVHVHLRAMLEALVSGDAEVEDIVYGGAPYLIVAAYTMSDRTRAGSMLDSFVEASV